GARVGGCGLLAVLAVLGLASRVLAAATAAAAAATTTARAGLLGVLPLGGGGPLGVGLVLVEVHEVLGAERVLGDLDALGDELGLDGLDLLDRGGVLARERDLDGHVLGGHGLRCLESHGRRSGLGGLRGAAPALAGAAPARRRRRGGGVLRGRLGRTVLRRGLGRLDVPGRAGRALGAARAARRRCRVGRLAEQRGGREARCARAGPGRGARDRSRGLGG